MKDFSKKNEKNKFILSYYIGGNQIIAKLADGDLYTIPYNEENEKLVLEIMETQVKKSKITHFIKLVKLYMLKLMSNSVYLGALFFAVTFYLNQIMLSVLLLFTSIPISLLSSKILSKFDKDTLYEINKLNYFLENKQDINETIKESNNMALGLNDKAKNVVKNSKNITINDMDYFTLEDLKQLRQNIRRYQYFGFDEEIENQEETIDNGRSKTHKINN